jgi:hypothetical protein
MNVSSQYFGDDDTPSRRFECATVFFKETFGTFPLIFEMIPMNNAFAANFADFR